MFLYVFPVFLGALILSRSLFVPSLAISYKLGALDQPNERKIHKRTIARGGGLSFFLSFTSLLFLLPISANTKFALAIGGLTTFLVGFFDDTKSLTPIQKLAGQSIGAGIYIVLKGSKGLFFDILTFTWIIFIVNATNICDGLNGLACGIISAQSICLSTLALIIGSTNVALPSLLLLCSVLGFLPNNFPNAKIFMGDCGALFLGFVMGALSSELAQSATSPLLLLSIYLIFRIPSADTVFSFFRRILKKKNPFSADKGHFHHRLLSYGFTAECTALALITLSLIFGVIGIFLALA